MKLDKKMSKIIAELEFLIGSECFNPKSYDGWNDTEGRYYRYPINVPDKNGNYEKIRFNINEPFNIISLGDITPKAVTNMNYKFGTNELFIGRGLIKVLEFLEKRYNLNFNELESAKKEE